MRVSVVVPTYRRPDLLDRCLAALARQSLPGTDYEIIVADDAAEEAARRQVEALASRVPNVRYVPVCGAHGPAAARNAGWRAARGTIIAFTDDDCVPDSGWLVAGLEPFDDPTVVAVTGQTIVPLPPRPTDFERNLAGLEKSEFITANCFCRRTTLADLGGFDERFTTAWREDSDLHFRLLDTGGKIVRATRAVVVHPVRQVAWGVSLREQRKALFEALLFRKHPRHFRQRIHPTWPADYYLMLASLVAAAFALAAGRQILAAVFGGLWALLFARFCWRRLQNTTKSPGHIAEMLATSALIPFLSIYWRLRGAARFRVLFW